MKHKLADHFSAYFKIIGNSSLRIGVRVFIVVIAFFCLSYVAAYLLQDGYVNLTERVAFDNVFYDMWLRLTHFDVTSAKDVIGAEAFIINGRTIAYFLPMPALVRGILSILNYGTYSVVSMLIGFIIFVVSSGLTYFLMLSIVLPAVRITRVIKVSWLIFITLGSPFLSILVNSSTYWEAIAWGAAMSMLCLYSSIAILSKPANISRLIFFAVACGLTLFTKPTSGIGASVVFLSTTLMLFVNLLKAGGSDTKPTNRIYHKYELIGASMIFCIFGTSLCALNFARWGNAFEFAPLAKHIQLIGNERGKSVEKYGAFQIDRIPENISYYFFPSKDNFSSESPFIQAGHSNYFLGFAKNFDYREPTLPIPVVLPVFFLFALSGFFVYIKNIMLAFYRGGNVMLLPSLLPAAISACIPGIILLPFNAEAIRYSGEFIPGIVLFSIYAIAIFLKHSHATKLQRQKEGGSAVILSLLVIGTLLFVSLYITAAGVLTERQIFPTFSASSSRSSQSKIVSSFPLLFARFTLSTSPVLGESCKMTLTTGWHDLEAYGPGWLRWTADKGEARISSSTEQDVILRGQVLTAPLPNNTMEISLNGAAIATVDLNSGGFQSFPPVTLHLKSGDNVLDFTSKNPAIVLPPDPRKLAIALRDLSMARQDGGECTVVRNGQ